MVLSVLVSFSVAATKYSGIKHPGRESVCSAHSSRWPSVTVGKLRQREPEVAGPSHPQSRTKRNKLTHTYLISLSPLCLTQFRILCLENGATHDGQIFLFQLIKSGYSLSDKPAGQHNPDKPSQTLFLRDSTVCSVHD